MAKGAKVYWGMTQFDVKLVAWAYLWSSPRAPGGVDKLDDKGLYRGELCMVVENVWSYSI